MNKIKWVAGAAVGVVTFAAAPAGAVTIGETLHLEGLSRSCDATVGHINRTSIPDDHPGVRVRGQWDCTDSDYDHLTIYAFGPHGKLRGMNDWDLEDDERFDRSIVVTNRRHLTVRVEFYMANGDDGQLTYRLPWVRR